MKNYGRYKNIRDSAWQVLIDYNINVLPINVIEIAKKADIKIIKNKECHLLTGKEIGLSIYIDGKWYIVFDENLSKERSRFTIAHELGHIFLGHSISNKGKYRIAGRNNKPEEEKEADMFAIRLLSPACVLKGLDLHTAEEISEACCISMQSAAYRAERMKILYERDKFFLSPLEKQVNKNFEKFIKSKKTS